MFKLRQIKWTGKIGSMEAIRNVSKLCFKSLKGTDNSEDLGIYGRIILKLMLWKQTWRV
jgi:hypothetical protein